MTGKNVTNYRPITIISQIPKLFESLVCNKLSPMLSKSISSNQHGFIKGRSTLTNLIYLEQFIIDKLEFGSQIDVIYTDYVKCFDRVNQSILVQKLEKFGINGSLLLWFSDYLQNRSQYVKFGDSSSETCQVPSGCVQGGHLSPLLFSIFVDDMCGMVEKSNVKCLLFADDTKFFHEIRSIDDCHSMQRLLDQFQTWCEGNDLMLNASKCHVVSFTRKKTTIDYDYVIGDTKLNKKQTVKDLGVTFDNKIKFSQHINNICSRAMRALGFVKRNSTDFGAETVRLLYFTLVRPILEYNSPVWSPHFQNQIQKIESIQRKFIRYYCYKRSIKRNDFGYEDLLVKFNMKTLEGRRKMHDILMLHRLVTGSISCPQLLEMVGLMGNPKNTRSNQIFSISFYKTDRGRFSPISRSANACNICNSDEKFDVFHCSQKGIINCIKKQIV